MPAFHPLIVFALVTAAAFIAGDAVMIPLVMRPLFQAALGEQMLTELRLAPAALFYIIHIAGLTYFAGAPALHGRSSRIALVNGGLIGLVAYGCYEMTSYTIMRDWTLRLVAIDLAWGIVISGLAAWIGALGALRFGARSDAS
jgi:uncharacterized membrane protein